MSSAPHSESISSVGGAIDGIGGRPLTRSLGLSVMPRTQGHFMAWRTNQAQQSKTAAKTG
jgi:hypothetical protein